MLGWQHVRPFRQFEHANRDRWRINFGLMLINTVGLRLLSGGGAVIAAQVAVEHQSGVLNWLGVGPVLSFIFGLLLLDCAIYWQHRLFHVVPVFWRLHRVHHTDIGFDASTAVRFHPIEILLSMYIKMALVVAFGLSPATVVAFEIILNGCALFNHGNVRIPFPWEHRIRAILVTPDMHRIHHSTRKSETNSNYGFSLSWWDRLFRSYVAEPAASQNEMAIGLPEKRALGELGLVQMLIYPFQR